MPRPGRTERNGKGLEQVRDSAGAGFRHRAARGRQTSAPDTARGESQPRRRERGRRPRTWSPQPPTVISHVAGLLILEPQTPPRSPSRPSGAGGTGPQTATKPGRRTTDLPGVLCPVVQGRSASRTWSCWCSCLIGAQSSRAGRCGPEFLEGQAGCCVGLRAERSGVAVSGAADRSVRRPRAASARGPR